MVYLMNTNLNIQIVEFLELRVVGFLLRRLKNGIKVDSLVKRLKNKNTDLQAEMKKT